MMGLGTPRVDANVHGVWELLIILPDETALFANRNVPSGVLFLDLALMRFSIWS